MHAGQRPVLRQMPVHLPLGDAGAPPDPLARAPERQEPSETGDFRGQRFKSRGTPPENRGCRSGSPDSVPTRQAQRTPGATVPEQPAAQRAAHVVRRVQVLPPILGIIRVAELRVLPILAPQAARPLPHVARHIGHAAYGIPGREDSLRAMPRRRPCRPCCSAPHQNHPATGRSGRRVCHAARSHSASVGRRTSRPRAWLSHNTIGHTRRAR